MRSKAADKWTLDWLRTRVRQEHHQVLAEYLVKRDAETAEDHAAAGYYTNRIVMEGFKVKNGMTAVPQAAIKCLKRCDDLDPKIVWFIVRQTFDTRQPVALEEALEKMLAKIPISSWSNERVRSLREVWKEVRNINAIREVMES